MSAAVFVDTEPAIFVDTNVLIYALDEGEPAKCDAARAWRTALWRSRRGRVSYQVLQEFYVKILQKQLSSAHEVRSEIRDLLTWNPVQLSSELLELGWTLQDRYRMSFGDAMIVAAAKTASCKYLLTDDLQQNQDFDGLMVISPFEVTPKSVL